jgi:hypothetical protein
MSDADIELATRESRAARRLGRLLRIERAGRFERQPVETSWRLIGRRARLIDELMRLDAARRSLAAPASPELDAAIRELAGEVDRLHVRCVLRLDALGDEIRGRRGEGMATGLRDGVDGRLLGRG